ncbi:MAG: DMT family transporter [Ruminococcaceae bacterium]|nr:DMT family transporter [Oscillospiraceae bacterium]
MGYLFLALALLCGVTKGYCGKKTSGYVEGFGDAMFTNTVRMVFCIIIGAAMMLFGKINVLDALDGGIILISAFSGITTSVFVVTWLVSVKKGAYMMLDVFLMLGVLVPILLSFALFGEPVRLNQWIGLIVLFVAVVIMCSYNNSIKEKITPFSFFLLVLSGAANGLTSFSQKLFIKSYSHIPVSVFNFFTYVFSAIVLAVFFFVFRAKENREKRKGVFGIRKILGYVLVMSVCLFLNSYFSTLAAAHLDSATLYPLNQGAALVLSSLMSAVFFKEKLTGKCIIGLCLCFAGLIIINVL